MLASGSRAFAQRSAVKVLFFISSLQCGGAERVSVMLCNGFAQRGWDVTLATFDDGSVPPFFPVAPGVRHVTLGLHRRSTGVVHSVVNNVRRVPRLSRFVADERPDRIVSFIDGTNVLALLASRGTGIPVIVSERIDPAQHRIPVPWRILRRLTYRWASAIVVQTRAAAAYFPKSWQSRIAVVPNPVGKASSRADMDAAVPQRIVAMGRLERQKGFDLLVRAFARIAREHPGWTLTILGEGSERASLEREIAASGVADRIALPGREADVAGVLRRSGLFVLSSRYEGFPNALCEAMALGLPVVSFDCPSGPAEIIRDGVDGLLVPAEDVDALASTISRLIADPGRMRELSRRAVEISDRFSEERIDALWRSILERGT
jgi:GalNAc-alpha-(1->4)-GalNAc-alpha-(1->3)-diNAcBac-PP-undecaprenol alpha-1,4-N-acetyl-D-galactosaminyltransferase